MSTFHTRLSAVLSGSVLVLAAGLAPLHQAAAAATGPDERPAETQPARVTLTLITGDVVEYAPAQGGVPSIAIRPAPRPGGADVTFATLPGKDGGYLVLPSDAAPMVAAGTLDEELFDVETLARDRRVEAIPLLVTYPGDPTPATLAGSARSLPAGEDVRVLDSVNGAALTVRADRARDFWAGLGTGAKLTGGAISKIWLDRKTRASLDKSVPLIGAPAGWERGFDGKGVKVAVLDTGIDAGHPDFAGRILASENFSDSAGIADKVGHGTHVASTVAGAGPTYKGVAPAASLLVGKILADNGLGDWSWAISGMEWAAAQGADVVNMSLGTCCGNGTDPMSQALNELTKKYGTLFVTAAGNEEDPLTVSVPAAADEALAVGAVDKETGTTLAGFSSKGPRLDDAAVKPNIVAPGVDIVAARSASSSLPGIPGDDRYTTFSGTSMATPHVAGAAAILAQQHPDWRAAELRDALTSTAVRNDGHNWFEQGSGRVDVARAVTQSVFATSVVDFRLLGKPATRQVTYRNLGSQPVTLAVSLVTRGWSGRPAPDRAVKLGARSVTVPANGTAAVSLTADPSAGPIGAYGGWVTASGGDVRLVTPFSYYTGPATHRLGVSLVNSYGTKEFFPGYQAEPLVYAIPSKRANSPEDPFNPYGYYYLRTDYSGNGEFWLPAGDYEVIGVANESRLSNRTSWVIENVHLDGDKAVTLDARRTAPIRPRTPKPLDGAGNAYYVRTFTDRTQPVSLYGGVQGGGQQLFVTPVSSVKTGKVRLSHQWNLEPPVLASATAGALALHPAYDVESMRRLTAATSYPVVSVGRGRPEDFSGVDVSGKLVLVGIPVESGYVNASVQMDDAGREASLRGAAGVVGFLDVDGGRARVPLGWSLRLGLDAAEGRSLRSALAKGPVSLRLEPSTGPSAIYHLRFDSRGRVPARPAEVDLGRLVRIDAAYHADKPDTSGWEYGESTAGEEPGRMTYGGSLRMPLTRTEYFGPVSDDVVWSRSITNDGLVLHSDDRFTGDDRRVSEQWFKAPLVPAAADVPPGYPVKVPCASCRDSERFVPFEQWRDSDPRHYSELSPVTSESRLFTADRELAPQGWRPRFFTVPGGPGAYRVEAVDTSGRTLSGKVTTTARFASSPPPSTGAPRGYACSFGAGCAFQPAVQITYDLPLDLLNRAPAGEPFAFDLRAGAHSAVRRAPAVNRVTVEFSVDDGATWRAATRVSKRGDGRFRVELAHPALARTSGFVSLRVTASDPAGGSTTQTVNRAYALR
ncbi:S8 family serine peptidase [Nonomuraea angiospora]|uniref:Subtilisin family serine protease n=1 Tax=Nonomuraea angiospora TaxID=46172 RepID=A0ABR9M058_9ACTN|nr:S8 family serine peptidase [Nonomuraea angiospora]MBE1586278.1 subtilisin family serine protease [Nonomuraea angiospora]